jgi:hypothetical protein
MIKLAATIAYLPFAFLWEALKFSRQSAEVRNELEEFEGVEVVD